MSYSLQNKASNKIFFITAITTVLALLIELLVLLPLVPAFSFDLLILLRLAVV